MPVIHAPEGDGLDQTEAQAQATAPVDPNLGEGLAQNHTVAPTTAMPTTPVQPIEGEAGAKLPNQVGLEPPADSPSSMGIGSSLAAPAAGLAGTLPRLEKTDAMQGNNAPFDQSLYNNSEAFRTAYATDPQTLKDRAALFTPEAIARFGTSIVHLMISQQPGQNVQHVANIVNSQADWLENKDSFAGVKGAVTAARSVAISTGNKDWLNFINNVQGMPVDEQQIVWAYISNPNMSTAQLQALHLHTFGGFNGNNSDTNTRGQHDRGAGQTSPGAEVLTSNPQGTEAPQDQASITSASMLQDYAIRYLQTYYPGLFQQHDAGSYGGGQTYTLNGEAPDALSVATALREMSPDSGLQFGLSWMDNMRTHNVLRGDPNAIPYLARGTMNVVTAAAPIAMGAIFGPAGLAVSLAIPGASHALRSLGGWLATQHANDPTGAFSKTEQAAGFGVTQLGEAFNHASQAVSWGINATVMNGVRHLGVDTSTKGWQEFQGLLTQITLIEAFNTVGSGIEGANAGADYMTPEAGRAAIGIDQPLTDTNYNAGRNIIGRYGESVDPTTGETVPATRLDILNRWYTNPISFLQNVAMRAGFAMTQMTPEEYWSNGDGAKFITVMEKVKADYPGDPVAAAGALERLSNGTIPLNMAKDIAGMDATEVPGYMQEYNRGISDGRAAIRDIVKRNGEISTRLTEIQNERTTLETKVHDTAQAVSQAYNPDANLETLDELHARLEDNPTFQQMDQGSQEAFIQRQIDTGRVANEGPNLSNDASPHFELPPKEAELDRFGQPKVNPSLEPRENFSVHEDTHGLGDAGRNGMDFEFKLPSAHPDAFLDVTDDGMGNFEVHGASVPDDAQSGRIGQRLYVEAARRAAERADGVLRSDPTGETSTSARHVWESLQRQGFNVTQDESGIWTLDMRPRLPDGSITSADNPEGSIQGVPDTTPPEEPKVSGTDLTVEQHAQAARANLAELNRQSQVAQDAYNQHVQDNAQEVAALRSEMLDAENKAADALDKAQRPPIIKHPEVKWFRSAILRPLTVTQDVFNALFVKGLGHVGLSAAGFIDSLPNVAGIINGFHPDAPLDWQDRNASVLGNWLRASGADENFISRTIGEMGQLRSAGEFDQWITKLASDVRDNMELKGIPQDMREKLTRWGDQGTRRALPEVTDGRFDFTDGTSAAQGTLPLTINGEGVGSNPASMNPYVELPNLDTYREATGFRSRFVKMAGVLPGSLGRGAATFVQKMLIDYPDAITQTMTNIFKGPSLATHLPSMIMRTQIEHALRASQFNDFQSVTMLPGGLHLDPSAVGDFLSHIPGVSGQGVSDFLSNFADQAKGDGKITLVREDPRWKIFTDPKRMNVGSFTQDLMVGRQPTAAVPTPTDSVTKGEAPFTPQMAGSMGADLATAYHDTVLRSLATNNGDVQATIDEINAAGGLDAFTGGPLWADVRLHDGVATGSSDEQILKDFVERKAAQLQSLTRSNPDLTHYVATGNIRNSDGVVIAGPDAAVYKTNLGEIQALNDNIRTLADKIHSGQGDYGDTQTYRALQAQRRALLDEQGRIEDSAPPGTINGLKDESFRGIGSAGRLQDRLLQMWQAGHLDLPDTINMRPTYFGENSAANLEDVGAKLGNAMNRVFKLADWADRNMTRGNMYYDASNRYASALEASGLDQADARAWGGLMGARETRDLMYNLDAKTSFQRSLKNIFWFEPVTQDMMYKWLVKIPAEVGWSGGMGALGDWAAGGGLLAAKAAAWWQLLKTAGVVKQNPEGQWVVPDPLLSAVASIAHGKQITYMPLSSMNPVLGGSAETKIGPFSLPGLAPLPAWAVMEAASKGVPGTSWLASKFTGGPESDTILPGFSNINYFWEATFGHPAPWMDLSPSYQRMVDDRAHDFAIQRVIQDWISAGKMPPRPEAFAKTWDPTTKTWTLSASDRSRYQAAVTAYTTNLMNAANGQYKVNALTHALASSFSPGSIEISTSARDAYYTLLQKVGLNTPAARAVMAQYVQDHPDSLAYSFYMSYHTGVGGKPLPTNTNADFQANLLSGKQAYFTPAQYARDVQTKTSYNWYRAQQQQALETISPTLNPNELILGGYKTAQVRSNLRTEWARYQADTPNVENDIKNQYAIYAKEGYTTLPSDATERNTAILDGLKALAPLFTNAGGLTSTEYKTTVAGLEAAVAGQTKYPASSDPTTNALGQYYTNYITPYINETNALFTAAGLAKENGDKAGAAADYSKIAAVNARYAAMNITVKWGGKTVSMPTPEQAFYANKPPVQQDFTRLGWATHPLYWNDSFQNATAGFPQFTGQDTLAAQIAKDEAQFHTNVANYTYVNSSGQTVTGLSPTSKAYQNYRTSMTNYELQQGAKYGQDGTNYVTWSQAAPIVRLTATNFGSTNTNWQQMVKMTAGVTKTIEGAGYSIRSYSPQTLPDKQWLYGYINAWRQSDPTYNELWVQLSNSVGTSAQPQLEGAPLYEAVLFDNYSSQYIDPSLIALANKLPTSFEGAASGASTTPTVSPGGSTSRPISIGGS
jgi:hypothetical protein